MKIFLSDTLAVIFLSLMTQVLSECISWFFIYRKPEYKRMKKEIEKLNDEITKEKNRKVPKGEQKKQDKLIEKMKEELKNRNAALSGKNMGYNILISILPMLFYSVFTGLFDGVIVAKLPFQAAFIFKAIMHRNLPGKDLSDCSFNGLYFLCNFGLRPLTRALFGNAPSRNQPSMFPTYEEIEEKMKDE